MNSPFGSARWLIVSGLLFKESRLSFLMDHHFLSFLMDQHFLHRHLEAFSSSSVFKTKNRKEDRSVLFSILLQCLNETKKKGSIVSSFLIMLPSTAEGLLSPKQLLWFLKTHRGWSHLSSTSWIVSGRCLPRVSGRKIATTPERTGAPP